MHEKFEIQLLGGFAVYLHGQRVRGFRTAKTRALLAYLAVQPDQEHSRVTLATLLWGALPDAAAKTNLRVELSHLKNLLSSHPALEIDHNFVRFRSEMATTDVLAFRHGVNAFLALPVELQGTKLAQLIAAINLYQGEFLAGLHLHDAIEFEEWQLILGEQLHTQMMLALKTLQMRYAEQAKWVELADAAHRQLALTPWIESAHRYLMQALAAQGHRQAAWAQYEKCRQILQEELGIEPSYATSELAARLRGGTGAPPLSQHNLFQPIKSFVGRKEEIAYLGKLVRAEKLVTLFGIGGVGKSHLAQAVAQEALQSFADGVWYVPLANIEVGEAAVDRIALAIAAAVGFSVTNLRAPLVELVGYLRDKELLLVLDNCEQAVEAIGSVLYTLLNETDIHILATSRLQLMAGGEIPFRLEGLPAAEAYTLFVDRARRVMPAFSVDGKVAADVYRVCEQVAGLPLGIELAASWVGHYSVAEIGQSIAEITVQPQQADGMVGRHHRLSTIIDFSWQLLDPRQQRLLAQLSLFRGGFDRKAASAVAESALSDLSTLISYSLLQRLTAGRYDLHPLVEEFAAHKLAQAPEMEVHRKFSHYFLSTLLATARDEWASQLLVDFENIRSAWQLAVVEGDDALVQQTATSFGDFIAQFGLMSDGNKLFADAVERFGSVSQHFEIAARLLDQQSYFVHTLHGLKAASVLQQRVLTLTSNRELLVKTHIKLANYFAEVGAWEQSDFHSEQAEAFAEEASDLSIFIRAVDSRIHIDALHFRGDFAQGIARLEEMLLLLDNSSSPITDKEGLRGELLSSLQGITIRYGDYARSIYYGKQNLDRITHLGHQENRTWILSDVGLAEQYAGMYPEAMAHFQEALALAREIGSADGVGILKVNLCLTLRQIGALEEALEAGLEAVETLHALGHIRIEGQARNRVGHTYAMLGRWADAYAAFGEAIVVLEALKHPNCYEAVAGRAVAALQLDKPSEALASVGEVLAFVNSKGVVGIVEPVRLFLNCEVVLTGVGQRERGHQALLQANDWVQTISSRISDEKVRQAFLNNRPDNQLLKARLAST